VNVFLNKLDRLENRVNTGKPMENDNQPSINKLDILGQYRLLSVSNDLSFP
jgi:hypothetical protein